MGRDSIVRTWAGASEGVIVVVSPDGFSRILVSKWT